MRAPLHGHCGCWPPLLCDVHSQAARDRTAAIAKADAAYDLALARGEIDMLWGVCRRLQARPVTRPHPTSGPETP